MPFGTSFTSPIISFMKYGISFISVAMVIPPKYYSRDVY
ncbi:hypothetical protein BACI349Y_140003 [Bacillus sp. 349Y]|nr:hypothetical protein BACI349Y_140003 [Bacillus sp. 349Y]